ncbi:MAG: hypothetical protein ACRCSG_04070 [Cellulosilyticaceae bacterium]
MDCMQYKHILDYFILNDLEEEERLALGNILNRLWYWDIEQYQELVSSGTYNKLYKQRPYITCL